jgi:hypothetical protein
MSRQGTKIMNPLTLSGSGFVSLPTAIPGQAQPIVEISAFVSVTGADGSPPAQIAASGFTCFVHTIGAASPAAFFQVALDSVQPVGGVASGFYGIALHIPFVDPTHKYALAITAELVGATGFNPTIGRLIFGVIASGQLVIPLQSIVG